MHSQHYASRATNLRESFFSPPIFYVLRILDSSLLAVVICLYKLEQHVAVWVGRLLAPKAS